ncbi:hypothetical protein TWF225_007286 [Orbilia oligospora]|nr:hypothetical protein TWF225_007286 [Orbilia oligospora]KAF3238179.1 hypothetical protein TWF128_000687 [Orbilia oligospora]KAF3238180.1 hypothetical protein TWF128_000687 [Orbilia oligospora]KAF3241762.1 hypothetical protein TWF217_011934 [Orbilia oligospora]
MNRLQRRDVRDRLLQAVEKRAPIQTITVDSEEFDRITRNWIGLENLAGITNTIGHATTLSTVPRAKSSSSPQNLVETTPTLTVKTPESKPALPIAEPVTRTVVTIGFTQPITSPHPYSTSKPAARQDTATTSVAHQTQSSAHSKPDDQHHDHVAGIVVGLVAAGITSAIVLLVGLFFFCRYRRRRELAKGEEGEAGRKSGSFGRGAKRSASQNSAESKRKLLARTTTREQNDGGSEDEHWKPDEKVHYPPYQHIPRNLGSDLAANSDHCDHTSRAVSPSSADTPLPELPIRPPTEIRNTAPRHRPSLPIELRPFSASNRPVAGLTRPQTAYGNNGPGRYIMSPKAQSGCAVRRSSTKTHKKKPQAPSGSPRGRAYTLNTVESPERLAPLARNTDMFSSSSSRSHSHSPTPGLNRRASTSSQRYSIFPKGERKASLDGSVAGSSTNGKVAGLNIPGHSGANTSRGISRVASSNSLREDASGIPTVWMNGAESPKASPTRVRVDGASGPPPDFQVPPVFPISRRSGKLQIAIPESPIDGTIKSISSTNSSILDTFKRSSGPLPIPEKSPLRPISPGYSIKSNSSSLARSPSPCPTDDSTEPGTPGRVRRRNTGYRSPRRPSGSPPPALPTPTIALPQDDLRDDNSATETITDESRSHNTMSLGTWSQITSTANTRPHSYSTNTTMSRLSLGMKEKVNTRFSASPIYESYDSGEIAASSRDSFLPTSDSHAKHQSCADQAVGSFFHANRSGANINRLSLEDIEYIEPELARCISITSTSGSCRTTIEFKPSTESLHSRMLSRSTIRTNDMRLEDIDLETCTDIEDVTATFTRSNSIASGYISRYGRPSQLGDTIDSIDVDINNSVISSTYSPTLSMYNFYSSGSARYSTSVAPPSSRSPIAARRNSIVPNISIPQPQLYSHPSSQLEIDDVEELALTSGSTNPAGGSLTSATSPLSFTTANSSEVSYSPPLDADIGAPIPLNAAVPIPTPQIYSSSQEDLSQMHINPTFKRRGSYMSFHPDQSYCDLNSALSHATGPVLLGKPSQNSLAVNSLFGGRFDTHGLGRRTSAGTLSTLDMSSFRDLDTDKSISSGLLESSSDESGNNVRNSMASDSSESDTSSIGEKRRSRSLGALTALKRKRSTVVKDVRGRSRERRLV